MSSAARRHPVHRDSPGAAHEAIDPGSVLPRLPHIREWSVEQFFAIVTDLVGTPTGLASGGGAFAWRSDATLWGLTVSGTSATAHTPLRFPERYFDFPERYFDPETGLPCNCFRRDDPVTAACISPDASGMGAHPSRPATAGTAQHRPPGRG